MSRLLAVALTALALPAAAQKFERPLPPLYDAAGITKACDGMLARARKDIAAMEGKQGGAGFFEEWNRLQIAMENVVNPIYLLGNVHPDKAVRDASEPCLQKYTTLSTEIYQSEKLFRRVSATQPANAHQAELREDLVEGFEDSGVSLPPDKRARAKQIFERLEELRQAYDRNVRDDPTRVVLSPAEMAGMPEAYLKAHAGTRDKDGNYVLTLKYPSYVPFMANARDEGARRKYYVAKLSEGGQKNLGLLNEIFVLRKELAGLYGLPTFADYALRRKMAGSPAAVNKFLEQVRSTVVDVEKRELEDLRAVKAKETGKPLAGTKIERWDVAYYQEKVRKERFSVDQEKLRKYFPTDKAVDFALLVSQRLYGVTFKEAKVPTWHPDVRYFDVFDAKTGRFMSGFFLDLFPREGKYGHAAAFPVRGVSRIAKRTPISVLVTNFNREGLDHTELETLMHEFGHVLHGVLSKADYNSHAGTSVRGDFVEAPSQMFEEWVRREQPLALFKQVCAECPQLTRDEIRRLDEARRFGRGIFFSRQWLYAAFDMALSTDPKPPLAVWKNLEGATPLGHVEGTMFPSSFSHIASNYAAGYYGYMWSQVIALDMLSAFERDMLDPKVGIRYRDTILAPGGQVDEMKMVRDFLGREPSNEAFIRELTGSR
jgi:thimet oligopeptidase